MFEYPVRFCFLIFLFHLFLSSFYIHTSNIEIFLDSTVAFTLRYEILEAAVEGASPASPSHGRCSRPDAD